MLRATGFCTGQPVSHWETDSVQGNRFCSRRPHRRRFLLAPPPALAKRKLTAIAGPALAVVFFVMAMRLLWHELEEVEWEDFKAGLTSVPILYLLMAAFLISLNYGLLITYDLLALRYICRSLPLRRVALVSFLGFTLGNNLGTFVAGAPIRFRFYGRWGIKGWSRSA